MPVASEQAELAVRPCGTARFLPFSEQACAFGSIKKDVKRKSSPASWKPRKVSASSPPVAEQVARGVVAGAWSGCETARSLDARAIDFQTLLSLLLGKVSSERPGAVKGAPFRRGVANPCQRGPF